MNESFTLREMTHLIPKMIHLIREMTHLNPEDDSFFTEMNRKDCEKPIERRQLTKHIGGSQRCHFERPILTRFELLLESIE